MQCPHFASCFADIQREKTTNHSFSCSFFLQKWKTSRKLERNGFVCSTIDQENCREPAKLYSVEGTRSRLMLSCTFYRSYFVFSLYTNQPFYSNSFIFNCTLRTKVNRTFHSTYSYPQQLWFLQAFFLRYSVFFVISWCVLTKLSILALRKDLKWKTSKMMNCLSMHIINTIPLESALYGIYALVVFISAISLFRCAHSVEPPVSGHPRDQG